MRDVYVDDELSYIYLIVTNNGGYVGESRSPLARVKQHQYRRISDKQFGLHEDMRNGGYRLYILDVRLGVCGTELEGKWITYFKHFFESQGKKSWNTAQSNTQGWEECQERMPYIKHLFSWFPDQTVIENWNTY